MFDARGNIPFPNEAQTMFILHLFASRLKIYSAYNKRDIKAKENFLDLKIYGLETIKTS